jgi:hypothetical protein
VARARGKTVVDVLPNPKRVAEDEAPSEEPAPEPEPVAVAAESEEAPSE